MRKPWEWLLLIILAAAGVMFFYRLGLPRYQSIDLSINQAKATGIAADYLKNQLRVDPRRWRMAVQFGVDEDTDRYLQRTLGVKASQELVKRLHYDLFYWVVRFFRDRHKEEYKIAISSATGEIIGFNHTIDDTAIRPFVDKEKARQMAVEFLQKTYQFNASHYLLHSEDVKKYDNRLEYSFSWQDKNIDIPWSKKPLAGSAKLLANVTVSGPEVLNFAKSDFEIPDGFNRFVDNLKQTGQNLILIFRIFYLGLMTMAIVVVVNRKHQVILRTVKPFYVAIGVGIFVLMLVDIFNSYQDILFGYPTSQSFGDYVLRQLIENVIGPFFIALGFVLPALGGESLRFEVAPQKKIQGLLSALQSSFCSVNIGRQIFIGYMAAAVVLGLQSLIFQWGFKHWGVWDELSWLTQATTTVVPAFTALAIGYQASFSEEAMFRLFAINLFKKYGLPTILAVFLSAMMWGFGHTGYEIFPMWFRGVEVTSIGIVMGIFYLRYGLVAVITAHFLVDSFLSSLPYLLNWRQGSFDFYSALAVVVLPLILGVVALIMNKNAPERLLSIRFNAQQQFNYHLLLEAKRGKSPQQLIVLKNDLQRHGWDAAIIERVFEEKNP